MIDLEDFLARLYRENDEMKHEIKALKARIEELEKPVKVTIGMDDGIYEKIEIETTPKKESK